MEQSTRNRFRQLMTRTPDARAQLRGSDAYPNICGAVSFWQTNAGVLILAEVSGLPRSNSVCERPIFAMHIHEGEHCTGNEMDPFAATGGHYNPDHCPHPFHAGDLPPLFPTTERRGWSFSSTVLPFVPFWAEPSSYISTPTTLRPSHQALPAQKSLAGSSAAQGAHDRFADKIKTLASSNQSEASVFILHYCK